MAKCKKKSEEDCLNCEHPKCILDMSESEYKAYKAEKKKEYYKLYYAKNKERKATYNHDIYMRRKYYSNKANPKDRYINFIDIRRAVIKLKKQIGEVNCSLVLEAIEKIEEE